MSVNEKKNRTGGKISLVAKISLLLFAVALLAVGVTVAKYIWEQVSDDSTVTSDSFYFTVDVLGDTQMTESETGHYSFAESQTGSWSLYGGIEHNVTLNVQNFSDNLRITQNQISYKALVTVASPEGTEIPRDGITLTKGGADVINIVQNIGATGSAVVKTTDTLTLTIPAYSDTNAYKDGTKVTVTILSSTPYEKKIELHFTLFTIQTGLFYEVVDAPNTPYAELVLINAVMEEGKSVQPFIIWAESLSIDNTNELTYIKDASGEFVQQGGMEIRNMQISRPLRSRESVSIYFFKEDQSKDYTVAQTRVQESESKYTIEIKELEK